MRRIRGDPVVCPDKGLPSQSVAASLRLKEVENREFNRKTDPECSFPSTHRPADDTTDRLRGRELPVS